MRPVLSLGLLAVLVISGAASAQSTPGAGMISTAGTQADEFEVSGAFGSPGLPVWTSYVVPDGLPSSGNAGEPTIGIPWNTDSVFYKARSSTYRIDFDTNTEPADATWVDVHPAFLVTDVDPMLHADPVTNRVWTGGLDGPCSLMAYSDDNGETWLPTGNMCSGVTFDHQTVGSGPFADPSLGVLYPHVLHYCAQLVLTSCASSYDGGGTWTAPLPVQGPCGGLHGHARISPATGTAIVPHRNCGGHEGFAYTVNDGLTWDSRAIEATPGDTRSDPSAQFTQDSGWLYYGDATASGAYIGLSKDEGETWETLGTTHGDGSAMFNVGALHDPPVVVAAFADVQAGDDDRVAYSFIGLVDLDGDGAATEYGEAFNDCERDQAIRQWHYFVAMSYDAGQSWMVQRVTEDPVQIGGLYMGQNSVCRNLLDFNDMDIDSMGRVYIGWSDGCVGQCVDDYHAGEVQQPGAYGDNGYRARVPTLLRQMTGNGLLAAYDEAQPALTPVGSDLPAPGDDEGAPGVGLFAALAMLAVALVLRRR